jgi:hypothetical protein
MPAENESVSVDPSMKRIGRGKFLSHLYSLSLNERGVIPKDLSFFTNMLA